MAEEERRRRRRGRRRGRRGGHPGDRPSEERPEEGQPEESDEEEETPSRPRFRFGFGRGRGERGREKGDEEEGEEEEEEEGEEETGERRHEDREGRPVAAAPRSVSPLSFWRRGRARTFREQPMPKQTVGRTWRRIRRLYFPPWVPVLFVIVVVFGILGALFFVRGASGAPRIGTDHWHATYQVFICGQRQANFPTFEAREGVHTHADGIIHIHPFIPSGEGAGARLVRWFEYGGGKLTQTEMRMPGNPEEFKNGDTCSDGSEAFLKVIVNGEELEDWSRYIPQDGDRVRIEFGAGEETEADRTVIAETEATRTEELTVTDGGNPTADTSFSPTSIEVETGETVRIVVSASGSTSHGVRVAGLDGEYETGDDFVSDPEIIASGEEGVVVIRFDEAGTFEFRDPLFSQATGEIVVTGAARTEELELSGGEGDAAFTPDSVEIKVGETVMLVVNNTGPISHAFRVVGPDGEYDTSDDFVSDPEIITPGEAGTVVVRFDEEGEFEFQDPSSPIATGTIVVVAETAEETPEAGTPVPGAPEAVDVTLDLTVGDNFFEPAELEVKAGERFRIQITNSGEFVHNLRIAGLDGTFETPDDLVSTPDFQRSGETGELVGKIDEPGDYDFRDDSHPTEAVGKITVKE